MFRILFAFSLIFASLPQVVNAQWGTPTIVQKVNTTVTNVYHDTDDFLRCNATINYTNNGATATRVWVRVEMFDVDQNEMVGFEVEDEQVVLPTVGVSLEAYSDFFIPQDRVGHRFRAVITWGFGRDRDDPVGTETREWNFDS